MIFLYVLLLYVYFFHVTEVSSEVIVCLVQ